MPEIIAKTPTTWAVVVTGEMFGQTVTMTFEGTLLECIAYAADHAACA